MTETMVNGMKFKVWNDTTRATFAESEDGRVEKIHDCGYITADLTIRKAIAMVYGLPTFRKNAVKTAKAVEETPITESKEQEVEIAEQTETETETTTVETSEQTEETKNENTHIWVTKEAYFYLRNEMRKQRGFKPLTKEQKEKMIIYITKNGMSNKIRLDHNSLGGGDGTKDGRWWGWNVVTLKSMLKKAGYSFET